MEELAMSFWANVTPGRQDECWEWRGARNAHGYGAVSWIVGDGPPIGTASRASYFLHHGPIPDDLFVCHACDNPPCVNPAHLWLGTRSENIRDCYAKRLHRRARNYAGRAQEAHA